MGQGDLLLSEEWDVHPLPAASLCICSDLWAHPLLGSAHRSPRAAGMLPLALLRGFPSQLGHFRKRSSAMLQEKACDVLGFLC